MILNDLIRLFERDLKRMKVEIDAYSKEQNLWKVDQKITNSAGNLCLHLIGNMSHFVGKEIGGFHYVRDRDFEFAGKNVPKATLIEMIEKLENVITASLEGLDEGMLEKDYPLEVFGGKMSHNYFLIHLLGHFSYHLGQINYHRRLLDK
ncbi:DinB family protein [Algoriphagus aquimarinus]|uniref:DinB family protein n=1 Tax=Algoriphagus aquimarinus TaxID=237018 RepID=UPI0030D842DC|tara:strand:+ start:30226 stop:30672 length:447 start_codon:yes stop_codon:yes gene_type:complete